MRSAPVYPEQGQSRDSRVTKKLGLIVLFYLFEVHHEKFDTGRKEI